MPDEDGEACGETYDHDEEIQYDGPDGLQWSCRRCGAEGWESSESADTWNEQRKDAARTTER